MRTIDPWLRLLRISNLPTVWSNTIAGYLLGIWIVATDHRDIGVGRGFSLLLHLILDSSALIAAFSLIYVGGMAMNDVMDAPTDARTRPQRPIPAGAISRGTAAVVTTILLLTGLALLEVHRRYISAFHEPWVIVGGVALIASVTAYNALHLYSAWSMLLMATCRGLVILTAAVAMYWPFDYSFGWTVPALALTIGGYTLCISIVARGEDEAAGAGRKQLVVGMIAAMPAIDALVMGAIGQWWVAGFCIACALLALVAQRRVLGT